MLQKQDVPASHEVGFLKGIAGNRTDWRSAIVSRGLVEKDHCEAKGPVHATYIEPHFEVQTMKAVHTPRVDVQIKRAVYPLA